MSTKHLQSHEIRKKFFDFFTKNGHTKVSSSSLIPAQDPTLLFVNAGMNQFKDVFLGYQKRSYTRAVTIQKCMRAGGKHNDLENVGFTKRHLTFFEMLGNFSFGDYFKKEAISFAWQFLTEQLHMDTSILYASIHYQDDESYSLWQKEIGLPKARIIKLGDADNFWQMGDTGPCGPSTEIYVDRGNHFGCKSATCLPGCSCDRFIEIWNLVFIQYNRKQNGTLEPLQQTGVDTGMGLERLCATLENKDSIFETDLFMPLIKKTEELTSLSYATSPEEIKAAFKVLADHTRATSFAIADGVTPSNDGRGYVLRKIIRRAALFAQKLQDQYLLSKLVPTLIDLMSPIYPELQSQQNYILSLLHHEIERFANSLLQGQAILAKYFEQNSSSKIITGQQAFKLYDTYGFPLELTKVIALEHTFVVDTKGFEEAMNRQRIQSGKKDATVNSPCPLPEKMYTHFTGYEEHVTKSTIQALIRDNQQVEHVSAGDTCYVITQHSPFYVECGGQVSDQGYIDINGQQARLEGLKKINKTIGAYIQAPLDLHIGQTVILVVDSPSRINTMKNHTATHLLQAALMSILGKHVKQAGSLVEPEYLRFDFNYHQNLSPDQIIQVEDLVNKKILENLPVRVEAMPLKKAQEMGVIAHFGEKYNPESVRVIDISGFSLELCGGTHVNATGDIGFFKITEVSALSAGIKRLVAVTGPVSLRLYQELFTAQKQLAQKFNKPLNAVVPAIEKQTEQLKELQQLNKKLYKQILEPQINQWAQQRTSNTYIPILYLEISDIYAHDVRYIAQKLAKKTPGFYFVIAQVKDSKPFAATISPELSEKIDLKALTSWLRAEGFQGGGHGTTIQGRIAQIPDNFAKKLIKHIEK